MSHTSLLVNSYRTSTSSSLDQQSFVDVGRASVISVCRVPSPGSKRSQKRAEVLMFKKGCCQALAYGKPMFERECSPPGSCGREIGKSGEAGCLCYQAHKPAAMISRLVLEGDRATMQFLGKKT